MIAVSHDPGIIAAAIILGVVWIVAVVFMVHGWDE